MSTRPCGEIFVAPPVIVGPHGNVTILPGVIRRFTDRERHRAVALVAELVIVVGFALLGRQMLDAPNVSVPIVVQLMADPAVESARRV